MRPPRLSALLAAVISTSCSLPGYFHDGNSRFEYRDVFTFLSPADRNPVLGETWSFIVLSDTHISGPESAGAFAKLRDHLGGAEFVVVTGDITQNGSREELRLFMDAARGLGVPCYPVIGNHDLYTARGEPWKNLIGSSVYRIDAGEGSLFILDNANAALGYDQIEWLEEGLKSAGKHTFVFAHQNFFVDASPPDIEQASDVRERARIMSLLKGRCRIMFMGHLHKRIVREYGGTRYIVQEAFGETGAFCRVSVSGQGVSYSFERAVP